MAVNTREDIIKMCRCVVCVDMYSVEGVVSNSCSSTDSTCRIRTPSSCAYKVNAVIVTVALSAQYYSSFSYSLSKLVVLSHAESTLK